MAMPSFQKPLAPGLPSAFSCAGSPMPYSRASLAASNTVPLPSLTLEMAPCSLAPAAVGSSRYSTRIEGMPSRLAAARRLWPLTT